MLSRGERGLSENIARAEVRLVTIAEAHPETSGLRLRNRRQANLQVQIGRIAQSLPRVQIERLRIQTALAQP